MKEPKLKPCPFCGGEAKIREVPVHSIRGEEKIYEIDCQGCSCEIQGNTKEEAAQEWNTRTNVYESQVHEDIDKYYDEPDNVDFRNIKRYFQCDKCGKSFAITEGNLPFGCCTTSFPQRTSGICGGGFTKEISEDEYRLLTKQFD